MKKSMFLVVSALLALSCRADLLIYDYSNLLKSISDGRQETVSQSGKMFFDRQTTNSVNVILDKKNKFFYVLPFTNQFAVTITGKAPASFTALVNMPPGFVLPAGVQYFGAPTIGRNETLKIAKDTTAIFPREFRHQSSNVGFGNLTVNSFVSSTEVYTFSPPLTQAANDQSQSLDDAVAAMVQSLENQGYQSQ